MEIRDYTKGDEKQILNLFELTYGKPMSPEYWQWRFVQNPLGKIMIKLMWDQDKLVGHYAVSPVSIRVNGQQTLAALSMTTMTHPEYNGRGIFTSLAEALYKDEAEKAGLKAVWGFPNNNSHYGFIKNLKWIDLEQIPVFSVNISKMRKTDPTQISVITAFSEQHVKTNRELLSGYSVGIERSASYLNWRYLSNPSQTYTIFNAFSGGNAYYAVCKLFPSFNQAGKFEVDLLELSFPNDPELLSNLITAITSFYSDKSPIRINAWVPIRDKKHIQLEKIGFVNKEPVTYSGIRILDSAYHGIGNLGSWYYSMGDSDIY